MATHADPLTPASQIGRAPPPIEEAADGGQMLLDRGGCSMLCISSWPRRIGESCVSASPRASHQVKNRVTAAAYAARVCGFIAVKNSTVRIGGLAASLSRSTDARPRRSREVPRVGRSRPPVATSGTAREGVLLYREKGRADSSHRVRSRIVKIACSRRFARNRTRERVQVQARSDQQEQATSDRQGTPCKTLEVLSGMAVPHWKSTPQEEDNPHRDRS